MKVERQAKFTLAWPRYEQLREAFDYAATTKGPVIINVKIANACPFPAEAMQLDTDRFTAAEIAAFADRYKASGMPPLKDLLK